MAFVMARIFDKKKSCKDSRLFFIFYKIAEYIGAASPLLPRTSKKRYAYIAYVSVLIALYTTFSIYEILGRAKIYMRDEGLSYLVILTDLLLDLSMLSSVVACLLFNVTRPSIWKHFLRQLELLERKLRKHGLRNFVASKNTCAGLVGIGLLSLLTSGLNIIEHSIHSRDELHMEWWYLDLRIYCAYNLFSVLFVGETARMIANRYDFLGEILSQGLNQQTLVFQTIEEVTSVYSKLHRLMKTYNEIVDWPLFFVPANAVLMILQSFNYCFFRNDMRSNMSWKFLATNIGIVINWLGEKYEQRRRAHQSSPYLRTEMALRLTTKQLSKDVRLFLASCKFAKAIGVVPPLSRKTSKLKRFASKMFISKLIVTYAVLFICQELGRIKMYIETERPNYVVLMLDTVLILSLLLSVLSCLLVALARSQVWRDFVVQLLNLEQAFSSCELKRADRIRPSVIRMILLTLITVGINLVEHLLQAHESMHEEKSYIDLRIWIVYNLFMVITVSNTAELMAVRYDFLTEMLIEEVVVPVEACRIIRKTNLMLSKMKKLVDKYNEIVYWPLFFVPANAVLMIVQCFNYCFFRNENRLDLSWKFLATNVGISLNWIILTIVMVMACDSVEKSGRKLTETCYLLQEGMVKSELRSELKYLAEYSEKLCPTFSAAGFYKVNQRVLAALFSIVTTYSIISIQFNIAH